MTVTYQREIGIEPLLGDIKALVADHWREFSYYPGVAAMDIDFDMYVRLHNSGQLHVITARRDGKLVGYQPFRVTRHHHRDPQVMFAQDLVLYVTPGPLRVLVLVGLVRYSEQYLREQGVRVVLMRSKLDRDIAPLLTRQGFKPLETVYGKCL